MLNAETIGETAPQNGFDDERRTTNDERTNERTNEVWNERTKFGTNEQTNERTLTSERTNADLGTNERTLERTLERTNERTNFGLWTLDFGLWTLDFGLWTGLWTLDFGLWTLHFGLWNERTFIRSLLRQTCSVWWMTTLIMTPTTTGMRRERMKGGTFGWRGRVDKDDDDAPQRKFR